MSQENKKHSFSTEEGTPLDVVMTYIKNTQGKTFKGEIKDWAIMMHYPYALKQSGSSFEEVSIHALESIRRLNQEISSMTNLIATMAIAEGKKPPTLSHLSCLELSQTPVSVDESQPSKTETQPEVISGEKRPSKSKLYTDPF